MENKQPVAFVRQTKQQQIENEHQLSNHWYGRWTAVANVNEIKNKGDFVTAQLGNYPLIIARAQDDQLVVLNNSCRHRGSRICQTERGNKNVFVCPYHQWTYDLQGNLSYAHNMVDEVECNEIKLSRYPSKVIAGVIYTKLINNNSDQSNPKDSTLPAGSKNTPSLMFALTSPIDAKNINVEGLTTALNFSAFNISRDNSELVIENGANNSVVLSDTEHNIQFLISALPDKLYAMVLHVKCFTEEARASEIKDLLCQFINDNNLLWEAVNYQDEALIAQWNNEEVIEAVTNYPETNTLLKEAIDFESSIDAEKCWDSNTQKLICTIIVEETSNVRTYTFQSEKNSWFSYKPGQFITLELPVIDKNSSNNEPLLRTYTLSSSPSRPLSISVTIKAQPDSIGSRWIFDNLKVGDKLKAYGPAGQFSFFNQPSDKYLFISAGSGITPMMSMTRWMFDYGTSMDINFISCSNSPEDILFKNELKHMANRLPDVSVSWVVDNDPKNIWSGYKGRFNKLMLGLIAPDYMERDVYCCGPPPFMHAVKAALFDSGYDLHRYNEESFSSPIPQETTDEFEALMEKGREYKISFNKSKIETSTNCSETLLTIAKRSKIAIPSACGFGVCGTCKVKVNKGKTHMVHNGGISEKEIEQGYVLACCSQAMEDVDIEV